MMMFYDDTVILGVSNTSDTAVYRLERQDFVQRCNKQEKKTEETVFYPNLLATTEP